MSSNVFVEIPTQLEAATRALNTGLVAVEVGFRGLDLGVATEVALKEPDSEPCLGFGRIGGDWKLYIRTGNERRPLLTCSRSKRIQAVVRLEALLEAMTSEGKTQVKVVEDAARSASVFADRLKMMAAKD